MYQVKIENTILKTKDIVIKPNEQLIDEKGELKEKQKTQQVEMTQEVETINEQGETEYIDELMFDEDGNPVMEPKLNSTTKDIAITVKKTQQEIDLEELTLLKNKKDEVQAEVDAYKAKQEYQRKHGGAGPVAKEEIMKIVNEYNSKFEVVFEEE
jgi:peroxiredoxin